MNARTEKPIKILIIAMGGEGGGVLTKWLVDVAESLDYLVQYTYIPGVAQRTGATSYYLELWPKSQLPKDGRRPVMTLVPCPGDVDVVIASEIAEAARATQMGFVTPDHTSVVTSIHRVYSIAEKIEMGDGRIPFGPMLKAVEKCAANLVRFDMAATAVEAGSVINAVLFGALAGSNILGWPKNVFIDVVCGHGTSSSANGHGFELGYSIVSSKSADAPAPKHVDQKSIPEIIKLIGRMQLAFHISTHDTLGTGIRMLSDYQDSDYANLYYQRMERVSNADDGSEDYELTRNAAGWLARLMAYDDVARVAYSKSRADRVSRIRTEVRANDGDIVVVTDFLKPRAEEVASALPAWLGNVLLRIFRGTRFADKGIPIKIRSNMILGYMVLWLLACMKRYRPKSNRFANEQRVIEEWLEAIITAAEKGDQLLALELVAVARLIKGYGPTHCRGVDNFSEVLEIALMSGDAEKVRRFHEASLAAEQG
ncbi:MAG: indolepyruvate oxidoreductase subunit beta family protein [Fimbriimonadaceae bacterium]|nr:indolepyruvate oxidoreductase subunit beta family protein [Alphaproteobacteria bacterium]